jgi:uncharacterized protein
MRQAPLVRARPARQDRRMKQQDQAGRDAGEFRNNAAQSRYELRLDGEVLGFAEYRREGSQVVFTHTEVSPAHGGQGLGSRLAAQALDDVRSQGLQAVPQCGFIAGYIARHEKEYGNLLPH